MKKAGWYDRKEVEEVPIPVLGPDIYDPRKAELIHAETHKPDITASEATETEGASI
jgi:hypothetical protein